jgi:hypothetical protein
MIVKFNEACDIIFSDKTKELGIHYSDEDSIPFTILESQYGEFVVSVGEYRTTHGDMEDDKNSDYNNNLMNFDYQYEYRGRLFFDSKVISFWDIPHADEWPTFIKELNQSLKGVKVDDTWTLDFKVDKATKKSKKLKSSWVNIKVKEYLLGGWEKGELSPEEKAIQHAKSPGDPTKIKKTVPNNLGSRRKYRDQKPGESTAEYKARTTTSEKLEENLFESKDDNGLIRLKKFSEFRDSLK